LVSTVPGLPAVAGVGAVRPAGVTTSVLALEPAVSGVATASPGALAGVASTTFDAAGDAALAEAIGAVQHRGGIVVMITHRPATLGPATHLAVMQAGRLTDFGERDAVLARLQPTAQPAAQPASRCSGTPVAGPTHKVAA
jgi:hypothetical protein